MTASQPDHRTWLVIGASGFVGSALTVRLRNSGERVITLSAPRLTADTDATADQLVTQAAAHSALPNLVERMTGVDCVILAAGLATPDSTLTGDLIGANSLLPALVAAAAEVASVRRVIILSSAAVQGRVATLLETPARMPFSPYSHSKALGEEAVALIAAEASANIVILRATSVQGPGRATTRKLRSIARSPFASVAGDGSSPSAVSSIGSLCAFIEFVGQRLERVPEIVLQPWEGLSTADVLICAGGRDPRRLPEWFCRAVIKVGLTVAALPGHRLQGPVRRIEMMWLGQEVASDWAITAGFVGPEGVEDILRMPD